MKALTLARVLQAKTPGNVFSEPAAGGRFRFKQIIVPNTDIDVAVKFLRWVAADDVNGAAGGVAPVQGALRAFQDLDAFHIKKRCAKTCG